MKRSIYLLILLSIIGCNKTAYIDESYPQNKPAVVKIDAPRSVGNIIDMDGNETVLTKSSDLIRTEKVYDQVVPSNLYPHLVVGRVFRKSSVVDGTYGNVGYKGDQYTIASNLIGAEPKTMKSPTLSSYILNLSEIINEGQFTQSEQIVFTMGQFSSYNELKSVFGNTSSTHGWFKRTTTTTGGEDDRISKATGIYVKFYQTSFTVSMDAPVSCYDGYTEEEKEDLVYLNSISYGRLGIMTLETNYSASYSYSYMKRIVKKLFSSSSTTLTEEEINFLDSCSLKIYYAGATSGQVVDILSPEDFIRSIHDVNLGNFCSESPGVPILCSFNNMKDDSRFGIDFEMTVSYDHVYAELKLMNLIYTPGEGDGYRVSGDIYIAFYRDKEKHPIIASPEIPFRINTDKLTENYSPRHNMTTSSNISIHRNTGKSTLSLWKRDAVLCYVSSRNNSGPGLPGDMLRIPSSIRGEKYRQFYTYSLEAPYATSDPEYTVTGFHISGLEIDASSPLF